MTTEQIGLILVVIAFLVLVVRSAIDAIVYKDALRGYREFVSGVTTNTGLTDAVESRYLQLPPEQKRWADQAFDLIDLLARTSPTDADNALSRWSREVRDGLPNTPPAPSTTNTLPVG